MNLSGKFELLNVNCMVDERSTEDEDLGSRVSKATVIWAERVRLDFIVNQAGRVSRSRLLCYFLLFAAL